MLLTLPKDVLVTVVDALPFDDIRSLSCVCRRLRDIIDEWKQRTEKALQVRVALLKKEIQFACCYQFRLVVKRSALWRGLPKDVVRMIEQRLVDSAIYGGYWLGRGSCFVRGCPLNIQGHCFEIMSINREFELVRTNRSCCKCGNHFVDIQSVQYTDAFGPTLCHRCFNGYIERNIDPRSDWFIVIRKQINMMMDGMNGLQYST